MILEGLMDISVGPVWPGLETSLLSQLETECKIVSFQQGLIILMSRLHYEYQNLILCFSLFTKPDIIYIFCHALKQTIFII